MQITLIFIAFFAIFTHLSAQQPVIAFNDFVPSAKIEASQYDSIMERLLNMEHISFQRYQIDSIQANPVGLKKPEKAAEFFMTAYYTIYSSQPIEFRYSLDTNGILTSAWFEISNVCSYAIQLTRISTGEVIYLYQDSQHFRSERSGMNISQSGFYKLEIPDAAKYVSKKPNYLKKTNPKAYNEGTKAMYAAYEKHHNAYIQDKLTFTVDKFVQFASHLNNINQTQITPIADYTLDKEKLDKATLPAGFTFDSKVDMVQLFSLDTIKQYVVPEFYGWWHYKDKDGAAPYLSNWIFSSKSKEAGNALLSGKQLYCSINKLNPVKVLAETPKIIHIALDADLLQLYSLTTSLINSNRVKLLDRRNDIYLNRLRDRYKREQFMDDNFQISVYGADIVFRLLSSEIEILDVKSGAVLKKFPTTHGPNGLIDIMGELLDMPLRIAYVLEEKNEKVKEVMVYNPFGFNEDQHRSLIVLHKTFEEVDGELFPRYHEIGVININAFKMRAKELALGKVSKGEKELYQLLQDKQEIVLKSKDFKFLGINQKL